MDMNDRLEYYQTAGIESAPLSEILYPDEREKLRKLGVTDTEINTWSVRAVHDTNAKNGFYACVIDTGNNEAAVAFRGSESFEHLENLLPDWIVSDLGLLNNELTAQQAEAERFLDENKELLSKYDSLMMTGHSLGGNLAEHATIVSDQYGLDEKITQCYSLDGPNFSDEYIQEHSDQIQKMSGKMTHYRWSVVGSLLFDLDGVDYNYVEVSNDANKLDKEEYGEFTRHDTKYTVFEGDSFKKTDGPDPLASRLGEFSRKIDNEKLENPLIEKPGYTLKYIIDLLQLPFITKFMEKYSNRYKTAAAKEAGDNTDFYIAPDDFVSLSGESETIKKQLKIIEETLKKTEERPKVSYPNMKFGGVNSEVIQSIIQAIEGLISKLDKMLTASAYGANLVGESINTITAVRTYLQETGKDFNIVEDLARRQMENWNP